MMKNILKIILPAVMTMAPMGALADQRFVVDYFKNFQTLEANFTQEIITKDREDTTSGQLIIEKEPSTKEQDNGAQSAKGNLNNKLQGPKFLFDYTKPYHQILVSDGSKFWFYDVDLMQVIIKPVKEVVNNPVLQILLSDKTLDQNFNIKTVRDRREYLLTPKVQSGDMQITDIQLIFANRKIYSFKVEDVTGQTISFVMRSVVENKPVDSSVFDFSIPKDVDIINETK
ncbi:outer membrane lipoprotein chaperone LolA [Ignatzschineria rhizosphaerae]|uniref:Outer-membrane lipoprotein carrier protein n=1 Tax=Ignatzschineria rhizosphaerae TaxID=2923279 RepID=A0ABY3X1Q9_9GAMM|nr:outer membrane lipoprotein chaperone LolA [Ignatzschineria rhizosphaerae]UNM95629.1 outer membrane lipoprotein chaperone LolA [Ignatzschineria rhizosphaerae]